MKNYKDLLAQKLLDLANLTVVTLIFGQAISGNINWVIFLIGLAFFVFLHFIVYKLKME